MVNKAKEVGVEAYIMSATELNFENKFDTVFSNTVLHWIITNMQRVKQPQKKRNRKLVKSSYQAMHL